MNAIILAGDRTDTTPLCGINKAFLPLEGWPLFIHVLAALDRVSKIEKCYLIGPRQQLMEAIEKALPVFLFSKTIEVLEQKEGLIENILYAYGRSVSNGSETVSPLAFSEKAEPVLFLPSDIPLVTPEEIASFIERSDMDRYDYCLGMTAAAHLEPFYPKKTALGIKMPYLYLRDEVYRINNLHLARLSSPRPGRVLESMYRYRRQKSVWNRLGVVALLLQSRQAASLLYLYFMAQGAVLSSRFGFHRLARFFRRPLLLSRVEKEISSLIDMRFKVVETEEGGAALDIDDEATYKTISSVFTKWRAALTRTHPDRPMACPFEKECHEVRP